MMDMVLTHFYVFVVNVATLHDFNSHQGDLALHVVLFAIIINISLGIFAAQGPQVVSKQACHNRLNLS